MIFFCYALFLSYYFIIDSVNKEKQALVTSRGFFNLQIQLLICMFGVATHIRQKYAERSKRRKKRAECVCLLIFDCYSVLSYFLDMCFVCLSSVDQ
jgi:hypothetical protein